VESLALAWVLGAAVFSLAVFALAALHMIGRPMLAGLAIICIAAGLRWRPIILPATGICWPIRLLTAVMTAFLAIYFIAAMAPSLDSDGYRYHLGFPHLYLAAGGLIPVRLDFYSAFPQGMEMLYLFALRFGGFSVANLLHWNFLVALAAGIYATGDRLASQWTGACAALAVVCSSVVGTTTASASVDVALAAAVWISFHAWMRWRSEQSHSWLSAASIAAGFAFSVKYTGATAIVLSAIFVFSRPRRARNVFLTAAITSIWLIPWLARNWLYFDNPLHPFASAWFPNPYLSPIAEKAWIEGVRHYGGAAFNAAYSWEATIRGVTTAGFTGPFFLLTPLAVLAAGSRGGRWLLAGGMVTALAWLLGNPITRFAIPTLPFIALALCIGLARWRTGTVLLASVLALHVAMDFPLLIERWNKQWVTAIRTVPWRQALRMETPESYWRRLLPTYEALRHLEVNSPPESRVLALDDQSQFFTTRVLANPYASEQSISAEAMLRRAADPGMWPNEQCTSEFPGIRGRFVRLEQRQDDRYGDWSIFEFTVNGESPRVFRAEPNPWEASLAVDGDEVTAWATKSPRHSGMWFETRWHSSRTVRSVAFRTSHVEKGVVRLAVSGDGGKWSYPEVQWDCHPVEVAQFERRSTAELRRRGWTHLLAEREYGWLLQAIRDPERWGVRPAYVKNNVRLIEITDR
jgi:hypothetical protein